MAGNNRSPYIKQYSYNYGNSTEFGVTTAKAWSPHTSDEVRTNKHETRPKNISVNVYIKIN